MDRNFNEPMLNFSLPKSLSVRRAWIENLPVLLYNLLQLSLSARRAWIENLPFWRAQILRESLSARRAWIEKSALSRRRPRHPVALRKESVDRKFSLRYRYSRILPSLSARRAWIEKYTSRPLSTSSQKSLSARRAWIEKCH